MRKPLIRKSAFRPRMWCCLTRVDFGKITYYKAGLGYTPKEAYEMWARINDVDQDS